MTVEEYLASRRAPEPAPEPAGSPPLPGRRLRAAPDRPDPYVQVCLCGSQSAVWNRAAMPRGWHRLRSGILRCARCK